MKRLYNEYGAAPAGDPLVDYLQDRLWKELQNVWTLVEINNLDPRDVENFCANVVHGFFAGREFIFDQLRW